MDVDALLERLRRELLKVHILQASLDALIVFLAVNLVLFVTGVDLVASVENTVSVGMGAVLFLLVDLVHRHRQHRLERYEEENPVLDEVLRTARDHRDVRNPVTQALFTDLYDRARTVTAESVIPMRRILYKLAVVGALSFLVVFTGVVDLQVGRPDVSLVDVTGDGGDGNGTVQLRNASAVLGEAEEIDAGDMQFTFNITGGGVPDRDGPPATAQARDAALDATAEMREDLALARRYSVAIKDLGD